MAKSDILTWHIHTREERKERQIEKPTEANVWQSELAKAQKHRSTVQIEWSKEFQEFHWRTVSSLRSVQCRRGERGRERVLRGVDCSDKRRKSAMQV